MNSKMQNALILRGVDIQGGVYRLNGDENLYVSCLKMFLEDTTVAQLNAAIDSKSWDAAFTAAHALKGLAGNLGFVPLMQATGRLVVLIRGGRTLEFKESLAQVNSSYRDIYDAISQNLG